LLELKGANINKHETFQFVTYNFKDLNIEIKKDELLSFLKKLYEELTGISVISEKKEIKKITDESIQYVLFYGDFHSRKGFEYIYSSKDLTPQTTASYYMFEQTIAPDFHIYFSLSDRNEALRPKRQDHNIEEIVVYMAQFFNDTEKKYEELFNNAVNLIDNFIKKDTI
jgi:hypothetical protein